MKKTKIKWIPIILLFLAIIDLSNEISILLDYFTFSALINAIRYHSLAFAVILASPSIFKSFS